MGEPRRIDIKHVGPTINKKKEKKNEISYRFEVKLRISTADYFPEISFADLVEDGKKTETPADPLDDVNMKEVEAIAKRMEEKYGGGGAKRKHRVEDFCDLGEGYDDNDSFIDNAEAYDELVPSYLTTKLGGFYINSGSLDFKEVANCSAINEEHGDDSFSEFQNRKKRKRRIKAADSVSEDEASVVKKKKRRKVQVAADEGEERPKKKRLSTHAPVLGRPRKNKNKSASEGEQEKGKKSEAISENEARKYDSVIDDVISQYMQNESSSEGRSLSEPGAVQTTSTEPTAAVLKMQAPAASNFSLPPNSSAALSAVVSDAAMSKEPPKLPESLPESFINQIEELKKVAECSSDSKQKFFSADVNRMLLGLERDSQQLSSSQRSGVYTYLASFLPVGRETLMKRIKQLKLKEEDSKLRSPIDKLKEAVDQVMPALIEKYGIDSAAAAQARLESREADAAVVEKVKEEVAASEEDERASDMPQLTENGGEKKARSFVVRKKFPWTESLRVLLCAVVQLKMDSYLATKTKGQLAEDFLKEFLDKEVKIIWPKGWMQTRVLYKESRIAHSRWTTQPQIKLKKPCLSGISKSADNSPMPQLRVETDKVTMNHAAAATAGGGMSAPSTPKTILDYINDALDSKSLDECISRRDVTCKDATQDKKIAEPHEDPAICVQSGNANNSSSSCVAKQYASQEAMPDKQAVASIGSKQPNGFSGGTVLSTSGENCSSCHPAAQVSANQAMSAAARAAAVFPALTAAVSNHQSIVSAASVIKTIPTCGQHTQGQTMGTAARYYPPTNATAMLGTSKVAASVNTSSVAAPLGDRMQRPTAVPSSIHSSISKVTVKLSQADYARVADPQKRPQQDHSHALTDAAALAHRRLQGEQASQSVATQASEQRKAGMTSSRNSSLVGNQCTVSVSSAHAKVGNSKVSSMGHPSLHVETKSLLSSQPTGSLASRLEKLPGSHVMAVQKPVQRPCALDGKGNNVTAAGSTAVPSPSIPTSSQLQLQSSQLQHPYQQHLPPRQLIQQQQPPRQLSQQQQQSRQLSQQQQSRQPAQQQTQQASPSEANQHMQQTQQPSSRQINQQLQQTQQQRHAHAQHLHQQPQLLQQHSMSSPEQLALKEMQRQQQGHLTVDQIISMPSTSMPFGISCAIGGNANSTAPAKLATGQQRAQTIESTSSQINNRLHQPWAVCRNSVNSPVGSDLPPQQLHSANKVVVTDAGGTPHGTSLSMASPVRQQSAEHSPLDMSRFFQSAEDGTGGGAIPALPLTRSPVPARTSIVNSLPTSGTSILTGSSLIAAFFNPAPKNH